MKKWIFAIILATVSALAVAGYLSYVLFAPALKCGRDVKIRLHTSWTTQTLADSLDSQCSLRNKTQFIYWIEKLGYRKVKPCTIVVPKDAGIYQIAGLLKNNRYQTVNVTILGSMNLRRMSSVLESKLEIDADTFYNGILDKRWLTGTGFNDTTWPALFLPNTYNFSVATTEKGFVSRMLREYELFWNSERKSKAEKLGFTPLEISIIASIVTKESNKTDEYVNIAGVYINRLRKNMLLQADPTVAFARGYDGRVLEEDLAIPSLYNTYLNKGLPPGPICIPNLSSIEAVLNYKGHDFYYFVADPDLNGYHHFSKNLAEHLYWAAKYHAAARELRRKNNRGNP